jgi:uncharacterized membrane protein
MEASSALQLRLIELETAQMAEQLRARERAYFAMLLAAVVCIGISVSSVLTMLGLEAVFLRIALPAMIVISLVAALAFVAAVILQIRVSATRRADIVQRAALQQKLLESQIEPLPS